MICGGYSDEKPIDEDCLNIFQKIKNGINYKVVKCVSYKSQIVNGINYKIKVLLDNNMHLILTIYVDLNNKTTLIEEFLSENY